MAVATLSDAALDAHIFKKVDDGKRGIPEAIFIDKVEELCAQRKSTEVVARLQELYSKYQYMQSSIVSQRAALKSKLPDIASALDTVTHLVEKREKAETEESEYTYQLAENLWGKASASATNTVCLWLGANCMLEYTLDEAKELLTTNDSNAKTTLKSLEEDMAFLRDQITTTEVNIARCHNFGVKLRQQQKEDAEKAGGAPGGAIAGAPAAGAPKAFAPPVRPEEPVGEPGTFTWKQDREEVEVSVALPKGAQKSEVKVTILADSLKVEHAGKVIRAGQLSAKCSPNGSTWTFGKGRVEISLEKAEAAQWASLFDGADDA